MTGNNVTSEDIRKALADTYRMPEWHLGFEVGNSTGMECRRHADAIAINSYPSRGFEIRGFEIKVSKSDLKSELDNGLKADEIARFCNYWFLVVPKGLTDDYMIPHNWGIIEYTNGKLRQKRKAEYADNKPDIGFMMAFMRGWQRTQWKEIGREREELKQRLSQDLSSEVRWKLKEYEELKKKLKELEKQTGISINNYGISRRDERCLKIAKNISALAISESDIDFRIKELTDVAEKLKTVLVGIKEMTCLQDTDQLRGL